MRSLVAQAVHSKSPSASYRVQRKDHLVDGRELLLLLALLFFYGLWALVGANTGHREMAIIGSLSLFGILVIGIWWQIRRDSTSIWQPLIWFRISSASYYGFGGISPYLVNETTQSSIYRLYMFNDEEALKVSLINVVSVFTVLATAWLLKRHQFFRGSKTQSGQHARNSRDITFGAAIAFLVVGGIARYFVVLPWTFGLTDNLPAIVLPLARGYLIGLFLLTLTGLRGRKLSLVLAVVLVPIDLFICLLTFSKTEVLMTLIFVCLALLHNKISIARFIMGFVIVLGIFSQLDPIIHYGRQELWRLTKSNQGSLELRTRILTQYATADRHRFGNSDQQYAISRLSYVNAAAMVVDWYDSGNPGDSLKYAIIVLIPRSIWPEKPNITDIGKDLYLKATHLEGSSISPGLFAEAYWNFGWAGIPIIMIPLSFVLVVFSRYSFHIMRREDWHYMPAVLIGVFLGMRTDGWFVSDVIGATAIALAYVQLISLLDRFVRTKPRG